MRVRRLSEIFRFKIYAVTTIGRNVEFSTDVRG